MKTFTTFLLKVILKKQWLKRKKLTVLYGVNYWTPQLLYIEALHHVKNRDDSAAIKGLQTDHQQQSNIAFKRKGANND